MSLETTQASECVQTWKANMERVIEEQVRLANPTAEIVRVEVTNTSVDRLLQPPSMEFVFDVLIRISGPDAVAGTVLQFIEAAFETDMQRDDFVEALRDSACSQFVYATSVGFVSFPALPPDNADTAPTGPVQSPGSGANTVNNNRANTGLVVGISMAAFAAVMLVALFVYVRVKGRRPFVFLYDENRRIPQDDAGNDFASEIGFRGPADVSTLSDPLPIGVQPVGGETSTIGSYSLDYDYQKAYQQPSSISSVSGTQLDTASNALVSTDDGAMLSTDDETLNAQYAMDEHVELAAPPGVLGLILETNEDGVPTVNSVKSSSALYGQVFPGDRLLSVDGKDVTVMLASDVSRLIASRRDNTERKLVFARAPKLPKRTGPRIDVESMFQEKQIREEEALEENDLLMKAAIEPTSQPQLSSQPQQQQRQLQSQSQQRGGGGGELSQPIGSLLASGTPRQHSGYEFWNQHNEDGGDGDDDDDDDTGSDSYEKISA